MARKYFSHATVLKDGAPCKRALYGIIACCKSIKSLIEAGSNHKKGVEDPKNDEMLATAQYHLKGHYERD